MTRKTRKIIFYALLAVFFLLGAAIVLYAQGWRFDPFAWRVEKVGAIYIRSFPADADISLGGTPAKNQSGFLSRGTLISDLFPRNYDLTLTESGYHDWHENAQVLPSLVTEFKYAVLVPQTPVAVASGSVKNFFVASGETVMQTEADAIVWRGTTIGRGALLGESANFKNIIFKSAATGNDVLYDFDENTSTNLSRFLPAQSVPMIDPYDATKVVAETNSRIFIFDAAQATTTAVARAQAGDTIAPSVAISSSRIAWTTFTSATQRSSVVLYDKFAETAQAASSTVAGKTVSLAWINDNLLGVLQDDGSLYIYDADARTFRKLADDVKNFAAAGDGSAVAALEHQSLEVFPLTDAQTYHRFNLPNVADAVRLIWYRDENHLFVVYPGSLSFLDIDDLGLRNFITVVKGSAPLYNPQENTLYLIDSAQKLIRFDFPS